MTIEEKIDALTTALKENTAAILSTKGAAPATAKADAPKADAKAGKPAKAAPKGPTRAEVTAAAQAYAKEHGKPAAKALIAKHGGADLASLPESAFEAFIAESQEAPGDDAEEDDGL